MNILAALLAIILIINTTAGIGVAYELNQWLHSDLISIIGFFVVFGTLTVLAWVYIVEKTI